MKKIVVGYDASPEADRALERAAEVAKAFDAEVVVTSFAHILAAGGKGLSGIDPIDPPDLHEEEARQAQKRLAELGVAASTVDGLGDPGSMIVKVAEAQEADLIVVGSHTASAFQRFFTGSVSDKVKHRAPCDVLVVR
jgi:nucleotide-binding universal stress UspA family protein